MKGFICLLVAAFAAGLTGCMQTSGTMLPEFNESYYSGNYTKASEISDKKAKENDLLWAIQKASAEKNLNNYGDANKYFEAAEGVIKKNDDDRASKTVSDYLISILGNASWTEYKSSTYEGVLINTYKATNYMATGQKDIARVEFNRALDRQDRAKLFFAREINLQKQSIEQKKAEGRASASREGSDGEYFDPSKSVNNPSVNALVNEKYQSLFAFEAYPDYVNPYTTYMAGIFFLLEKDYNKSVNFLKESAGMTKSKVVQDDFILADSLASSLGETQQKYTWIVFENGLGPIVKERRLDLPVFLVSNTVQVVSVALPTLEFRNLAVQHLVVSNGRDSFNTQSVASMDRIVQTEFKKEFPMVLTNALISSAFKAYTQHFLSKKYGAYGKIGGALYAFGTTGADVRSWSALPKDFQAIRVPVNGNPIVVKDPSGKEFFTYEPKDVNSIAFVRLPTAAAKVSYDVVYY